MKNQKTALSNAFQQMNQYGMIIVLLLLTIVMQIITQGLLLTPLNLTNIVLQNAYVLILAIGVLPIIVTGNIDLSIGSVVGFVGAIAAILQVNFRMDAVSTVLICLIAGALVGMWQGFWVASRGIPSFIVTLSSLLVFRGLTILLLGSGSLGPLSKQFQSISSSFLPNFSDGGLHLTTMALGVVACVLVVLGELRLYRRRSHDSEGASKALCIVKTFLLCAVILVFSFFFASYNGMPSVLLLLVLLVLLYSFLLNRSVIGRHIYAIGGNRKAADLSGVKSKKIIILTFINMGVLAGLAAVVFTARLNAGTPKAGTGFELDAIAACFIGGVSVTGGAGTIMGAIIGCGVMAVMNNGMSILGVPIDLQQAIKGLVILFAVAIDLYSKSKEK